MLRCAIKKTNQGKQSTEPFLPTGGLHAVIEMGVAPLTKTRAHCNLSEGKGIANNCVSFGVATERKRLTVVY